MEEEDDDPPLAVEINETIPLQSHNNDVSVGVTVVTGYLGAGKSTVNLIPLSQLLLCFLEILVLISFLRLSEITKLTFMLFPI